MASATSEKDSSAGQGLSGQKNRRGHEVEEYDCGCKVQFRQVDYGESGHELPRDSVVVSEHIPCPKHKGVQDVPPRDARLIKVRREYESFLNE